MPVCELQRLRSISAAADKAKRACELEPLTINMSFLKEQQGQMWRFLALVQLGHVPLQLQVKIPEQKWLSFTISLKHVQSDKGIKTQVLLYSQISSFTVKRFYPTRPPRRWKSSMPSVPTPLEIARH